MKRVLIELEDGQKLEVNNEDVRDLRFISSVNGRGKLVKGQIPGTQDYEEMWKEYFIAWNIPLDIPVLND